MKSQLNKLALTIGILFLSGFIYAQTGPGGVGNADGSNGQPELLFWLNADSLSFADTDPVTTWRDISGNNHDFIQGTANNQPVYETNGINSRPTVIFDPSTDSNGDYLIDEDAENYIDGLAAFSFITVLQSSAINTDAGIFDTEDPDGNDDEFTIRYDDAGASGGQNDVIKTGINTTSGNTSTESSATIQTTDAQMLSVQWESGNEIMLYENGTEDTPSSSSSNLGGTLSSTDRAYLGRGPKDGAANAGWHGSISEVIFFGNALNSARRTLVENYLAIRYNLTIGNDKFAGNGASYKHNLAGIGKESDGQHTEAYSAGFSIEDNGNLDNTDYLLMAHNNATNDIVNINTGTTVTNAGSEAAWNREWYMDKTGNLDVKFRFNITEGIDGGQYPGESANYVLLYRANTSSDYSQVSAADGIMNGQEVYFDIADTDIADGYYTLGTTDQTNSPVEGEPGRTWYTLISGDWENWEVWTLDPSGALPNNPDHEIPSDNATDNIVIKSGKTITVNSNNISNGSLTVEGRIDFQSTTGHTFSTINGGGRILLSSDNFPGGDATHFISAGQGEGTVEHYGTDYTLATARTYYDMVIDLTAKTNILTLTTDYTLNGNLTMTTGVLQINDNSATTLLTFDVANDISVSSNASITVGTGDAYNSSAQSGYGNYHKGFHILRVGGDFTNYGIVKLTNQTEPNYDFDPATENNGAVSLVFYNATNNKFTCDSTTILHYLIIDKGTGRTYELELYTNDKAHFALYGDNDENWNATDPANPENRKALWIANGSLRLTGFVFIPSLSEGSRDFTIGENAALILDGENVYVSNTANENSVWTGLSHGDTEPDGVDTGGSNQGIYPFGKLQVDDGTYYLGEAEAINFRDEAPGIIEVNGGVLEANQIAISSSAALGNFSFIINGGEVHVTNEYNADNDRAMLNLDNADMTFTMTGGALYIEDVTGHTPNGIHIASSLGNYNVTGGTVYLDASTTMTVSSTAPFYNLQINNGTILSLQEGLTVLNDLTISTGATLDAGGYDVEIGDDLDLKVSGTYTHGGNTTRFIGNGTSFIYIRNTTNLNELVFNNLEISKDQRYNPSLFHKVEVSAGARAADNSPILMEGDLTITRGEFDVDEWEIQLQGNLEIVDGQILATSGADPEGRIVLNGSSLQTIEGSASDEQDFGHLEVDNLNGAKLLSDINVSDFTLTQGIMDLDIYNLDVSGTLITSGAYSSTLMYKTAGNPSDGGITRYMDLSVGTTDTEFLYPFGTGTIYTPAKVIQSATIADDGKITINPASAYHPSTSDFAKTIPYYWVVDTSGFSTVVYDELKYTFTYPDAIPTNAKKAFLLWNEDYDWYDYGNALSGNDILFPYNSYLTGDFTLGNTSVFQKPRILYTRLENAVWDDKNSWSENGYGGSATNKVPSEYDIIKIGYSGSPGSYTRHRITLDVGTAATPIEVAGLILEQNPEAGADESEMSRLIITPTRGLRVNGKISGDGEIQFQMDASNTPLLEGDFGEFVNTEGASFIMRSNNGDVNAPTNITRFPRLSIPGSSNSYASGRSVSFTTDIYCHNLNVRYGGTLLLNNGAEGDIEVRDSLRIGGIGTDNEGRIIYQNNGTARTIEVGGNLIHDTDGSTFTNNHLYVETGGTDDLEHQLIVSDDIILRDANSLLDLFTANDDAQSNVVLTLSGEDDGEFFDYGGSVPEFYRIVMNKQESDDFDFSYDFDLMGPTNGDEKALELISGRLMLTHSDIAVTLTSGGADFYIPAAATLYAGSNATVNISGDDTGILLDGTIHAGYGTIWNLNGGTNNYIEYTASGNAEIDIYQAEFYVGSQIRRSTSTEGGILSFNQNHSNSTVVIGTNANDGGAANRGVFELVNAGCYFSQVQDAQLNIANAVNNASAPSLHIDLDAAEVSMEDGAIIAFGSSHTDASQNMGLYSAVNLKNIVTDNTSGNSPQVTLNTVELKLDSLTIAGGTTFDANGLDLTLYGDFTNNGTFTANNNSTYFSGLVSQQIAGSTNPEFFNLYKNTLTDLSLGCDVTVNNVFNLSNGTLTDNSNLFTIKGNINFDGTHTWGGSDDGIYLNGSSEQTLTGNGTFSKLTINNISGITVPTGNSLVIEEALKMMSGVFDIDKNLLILNANAEVEEANVFSETNMIQTNASFTDAGIRKYFPAIASNTVYTFPLGSEGKFTPVEFSVDNINSSSYIRMKAANEYHPSIQEDDETPDPNITDNLNVLQYHWVLDAVGVTSFSGDVYMTYDNDDVLITNDNGSTYSISDYITARLLSDGSGNWNKYDNTSFEQSNSRLKFSFDGTDNDAISGDYTAGIDGSSFNGAIPDQVPTYHSTGSGNWTSNATWVEDITGGPRGAIVIIEPGHEVTLAGNYSSSYNTTINGSLTVGSTFGHRLGTVDGTGTLYLESGNMPAGVYDDFFAETGGTLEYSGSGDYDVLSEIPELNSVKLSGTGERRLPNIDITIQGDFTIDGADVVNEHSTVVTLEDDLIFSSGTFTANSGSFSFAGTAQQDISGALPFTGSNALYDIEIDNTTGLTLSNNVEISNTITFTDGLILPSGNTLTITNTDETAVSGASSSSYINGALSKVVLDGENFAFPVGNASQYKPIEISDGNIAGVSTTWTGQYLGTNNNSTIKASDELESGGVSEIDRWSLGCPTSATGQVTLHWNAHSQVDPALALSNIRVAKLDQAPDPDEWFSEGNTATTGNQTSGSVTSDIGVSFSVQEFTLGTTQAGSLPIDLLFFNAENNMQNVRLSWATAAEWDNDFFVIERLVDGLNFEPIETVNGAGNSYVRIDYMAFDYNPIYGLSYYRLKQVDFDGKFSYSKVKPVNYEGMNNFNDNSISIYPNPYEHGELTLEFTTIQSNTPVKLSIVSMGGQPIFNAWLNTPNSRKINLIPMAIMSLPKGIYFVTISSYNHSVTKKLLVN